MTGDGALIEQLGAALGDGYEVVRALGEGGFAVVYLVRDKSLKRDLAVKVLSPELITSKTILDRFRREAETIAQLSHANIVPLHFIGQKDDLLYLAMQCVAGGSIGDRLARDGPLPVDDVRRVVSDVASALGHAHKRGVIHRDIKPANVLVDAESGRCLVTDFGIARSSDSVGLTATGVMVGTPAYLSPEQVTGEKLDHRVDIYALGVMAYELLTGRIPFEGPTAAAAMMKRLAGPPDPVTTIRADVPKDVADAITQCLATDPGERPQTADDVIQAFGGNRVTTGGRATRVTRVTRVTRAAPVRRSRFGLVAIGASLAALIGLSGAAYFAGNRHAASATPSDESDLAAIPAGDYVIGSDGGLASARPRHVERVAAFRIGRTEVTVGEYRKFVAATSAPSPWQDEMPAAQLPVTHVPWGDAANYCAWRYRPGGRLPTEIEWEAAARGREGRAYPSGNALEPASANTASAHRDGPAPVGSFPRSATPEGLLDMSGNVWEWTSSPMAAYPGAPAMADSLAQYRVIRGGAFDTGDSVATAWWRGYVKATSPPAALPNTGFRCVGPI